MPAKWRIEPLDRRHDRGQFDCGEPALNDYLARYARQHQETGIARTFVAVDCVENVGILGFYSLAVGGIDKRNLPVQAAKHLPNFPIPMVRLARLAVDVCQQGQGLGEDLLIDALHRCLRVGEQTGILAVLVDAKHEHAKAFYSRYEFESLPNQPLQLWLPMSAVRRLFKD
jgi:GNAT superfamily N-acetyltransferase